MRTIDRILAVSDLHGQNTRFLSLLEKSEYNPQLDLLVVCGDMIDRGKENLDCLAACKRLKEQGAILLKGNHEQFLEQALLAMLSNDNWRTYLPENLYTWIHHNNGMETFKEIKHLSTGKLEAILHFVQGLSLYFAIGNFIFTHAGANVSKPIEQNTEDEVVWMEETFPWSRAYQGKTMVFGHVPTWRLYSGDASNCKSATIWYDNQYSDKIGIDCGGIFGGRLAALELPSYREFYV